MDRPEPINGGKATPEWPNGPKPQTDRSNGLRSQIANKGMLEGPGPGRRQLPKGPAPNAQNPPPPPMPSLRKVPSNSNLSTPSTTTLSATTALLPAQVIGLAREAMRHALESETQAAEANAVTGGIKTGVTIDMSRKNIHKLPEEVVDIVKNELERLALSHNQISTLPARFSECTSLRYLNIRGNQIKEFPMALCDLQSLEILDLGRNQLRVLPNDISRLTSLKVLSVPRNQIRELPLCLADMSSLQVLKFEGNPISFPPRDAIQLQAGSPPQDGAARDTEVTEVAVTSHIKKFLRQYSVSGRMDMNIIGEDSSETVETPRGPLKRAAASGRFPIRVNGTDVSSESRSSSLSRPPPVPNNRAHYRGLSQQSTVSRRPGVMPLTIGSVNERLRSNSETLLRSERSESRNRRMGIVSKKGSDLGTLDETQANNRFSHYRGLSHGSAMLGPPVGSQSPSTPTDPYPQRPVYVRRLSVLPERRRESKFFDPIIESAKGILYAVFQIHPMIQMLMSLTSDGSAKRSSLEIVFYNTNSHVEELEQAIQKYDIAVLENDSAWHENEGVHRACQTLVNAYGHVCTLLADNVDTFVDNGDPRYIRTLLMLLFNSIMELRATMAAANFGAQQTNHADFDIMNGGNTIRPHARESSLASVADRQMPPRGRSGAPGHNPGNLRVATNVPLPSFNGATRTAVMALATPRSDDSIALSTGSRQMHTEFSEEDAQFEKIFLSLQRSTDTVLRTLPGFHVQLSEDVKGAMHKRAPNDMIQEWRDLIISCGNAIQQTEILKSRLSMIKLKEPGIRSQPIFWALCSNFILSWTDMASRIKSAITRLPLPADTRLRLRPIQQCMKETSNYIMQSPWHQLLRPTSVNGIPGSGGSFSSQGTTQLPITPQSAALGPAMQATVPATPQGSSFASAFQGNVFDRADALMANPGISMPRGHLFRGHSGLNSLSSISSLSSDGGSTPSSSFSSNGNPGATFSRHPASKPVF
jgi:hypothetical protein